MRNKIGLSQTFIKAQIPEFGDIWQELSKHNTVCSTIQTERSVFTKVKASL